MSCGVLLCLKLMVVLNYWCFLFSRFNRVIGVL